MMIFNLDGDEWDEPRVATDLAGEPIMSPDRDPLLSTGKARNSVSVDVSDPRATLSELEASSRFLVQQVFKPIANEYRISIPRPGSTDEAAPSSS